MRTVGVVFLGAIASWLVAMGAIGGAILLGLVAEPGSKQQFTILAIAVGMAVTAFGTAIIFSIVLAFGGRKKAIRWTAIALAGFLLLVLAAPLIFGLATTDATDTEGEFALQSLTLFMTVVAVPGLAAIAIQWWAVRRYVDRGRVL